jgi:ketosteroid isomerase-like protein
VLNILEQIRQAVSSCRTDDYATHWADGSTIFISSGNPLMSNQEYLGIWRQVCAGGGGMTIGPVEEEVTVLGEGVALVTGSMGYTFTAPDGEAHIGTTRTTTVLREIEGEWKLVHAHASELGVHGGVADSADNGPQGGNDPFPPFPAWSSPEAEPFQRTTE